MVHLSPIRMPMLGLCAMLAAAPARADSGPLSPEAALRTLRVDKGLRVDLVAAEPLVMDPVAMAIDENGMMFVAEMGDYPLGPAGGRIKQLWDDDGDGRMDRAVLFADKLPYPTGVMPWRGGVLVTAAPDIVFLKDTDGDGKSDVRDVMFTGFVEGNQQHRVNGLVLGLDNLIYGASGGSGGKVRSLKDPAAALVDIRGTDFRFGPDMRGFQIVAGHSQYANSFDDWGHRFTNDNSHHIRQPVLGQSYLHRSPHLGVGSVEQDLSDHGSAAEIFPASALAERPNDQHAAGHFTSACSVTIYRGNLLPPTYRGSAFVAEPVHNLVHRDILVPKGGTFVARRADEKREFLASTDNWFRPVNFAVGPDGSLFVVDMYRAVIEHPQWIPLEMQKRVDLRAGQDRGRIYRVVPEGYQTSGTKAVHALGNMTSVALVAQMRSPNAWQRTTAQRLLIERRDLDAVPALVSMTRNTAPLSRLHAFWTLSGLGALDVKVTGRALLDQDSGVREAGLRLAEPLLPKTQVLKTAVLGLAKDPSARVRFQAALSLGELGPDKQALTALAKLAVRDGGDRWTRLAILSSIAGQAPEFLSHLRTAFPAYLRGATNGSPEIVQQLAEMVGAARDEGIVVRWLREIAAQSTTVPEDWRLWALASLGPSLRRWGVDLQGLIGRAGVGATVMGWTPRLLAAVSNTRAEAALRVNAIAFLSGGPSPKMSSAVLENLLRPQEPSEVQVAAVRALATTPGYAFGTRVIGSWAQYTAAVRREALVALLRQESEASRVLEAVEQGTIQVAQIDPPQREALERYPTLKARARKLFEARGVSGDAAIAALGKKVLTLKGVALRGEGVYGTSCSICHRLHGQGYAVGPGLESVVGRDKEALLTDVLNPNRAIDPKFQVYVVRTATQEVSGIVAAENSTSITLRAAMGVDTVIARRDIVDMKAYPSSMMPEGLESNLTPQDLADLLQFLSTPKAVP